MSKCISPPALLRLLPLAVLAIAACSQPGAPAPKAVKADADRGRMVAQIRAAGTGTSIDQSLQIQPLRDPAVDGYLDQAHAAEAAHNLDAALKALAAALKLAPDAPDILQYEAEIEIERGNWLRAEQLAMRSYELGPRVGALCARNWQTMVEVRSVLDDPENRDKAQLRKQSCDVPPPKRM